MQKNVPAISIVMPMYNSENFIVDCLESVLAQTFTDFEFIIVDDCSTDNSCAIVESYMPKFGGKLKLFKSEKNSGTPSVPRNTGIRLSRGEYICFLDSDDGLMPTALEEIHRLTTKFKVDVIHCDRYYVTPPKNFTTDKNLLQKTYWELAPFVNSPTFLTDDFSQRIISFTKGEICTFTWCHIIRRDFLIQRNIFFPPMRMTGDFPYTFHIVCEAETFLRVPNLIYIYRDLEISQSRYKNLSPEKWVYRKVYSVFYALIYLDNLMNKLEFFDTHRKLKYAVLDNFLGRQDHTLTEHYKKFPIEKLIPLIQNVLNDMEISKELISFLFSRMNLLSVHLNIKARS